MAELRSTGLQTIFGFFLGLMVTSFVGVGVYTFYPPLDRAFTDRSGALNRQQQEIRNSKSPDALTPEDRAKIQDLQNELNDIQDTRLAASETWGRRTSIILIALATLTMAVSLLRAVQLPVISNGLLLGGLFTMIYGVGWIIATDTSTARFFVMSAALAITLGLGYVKFVHQRGEVSSQAGSGVPSMAGLSDLERRLQVLEDRMAKAADALGHGSDQPRDT